MANGTLAASQLEMLTLSGTGIITIVPPNTNTNRTLTLPDATGTVLTSATTTGFPAGSVLQVVNAIYSTPVSNITGTLADTGLTASITPTSATSKILVIVDQSGVGKDASDTAVILKILRGASVLTTFSAFAGQTSSTAVNTIGGCGVNYLDSPATTSNTTYKTQFASYSSTSSVYVQKNNDASSITLMEIAG